MTILITEAIGPGKTDCASLSLVGVRLRDEARPEMSPGRNAPVTKLGLMSEKMEVAACHGGIPTGFHAPLPKKSEKIEVAACHGGKPHGISSPPPPPPQKKKT